MCALMAALRRKLLSEPLLFRRIPNFKQNLILVDIEFVGLHNNSVCVLELLLHSCCQSETAVVARLRMCLSLVSYTSCCLQIFFVLKSPTRHEICSKCATIMNKSNELGTHYRRFGDSQLYIFFSWRPSVFGERVRGTLRQRRCTDPSNWRRRRIRY